MIYFVGIDPGKHGCVAVITEKRQANIWSLLGTAESIAKTIADVQKYMNRASCFCIIERQQAYPGCSAGAMFEIGFQYGMIIMAMEFSNVPYEVALPRVWKRSMGCLVGSKATRKQKKQASIALAEKLFPHYDTGGNDNEAEALLLADYARRVAKVRVS